MGMRHGSAQADAPKTGGQAKGYVMIAIVYLLGLFIGSLDTGIVTPARTVIQNGLGVDDQLGIWMITIYTLAYAASIPIMGKLADKYGRKYVYLVCILLFGIGSLFCGMAQQLESFWVLIAARAVQAIGGGGIMPIANAEFGTAFPEEKRGMALGLVGGVYGIANVFGSAAGSAILDLFGHANWQYIFYINVPICVFIAIAGFLKLPNSKDKDTRPMDLIGTVVMTVMILSLMYGLKNFDFFNMAESIRETDVWPYLLGFLVLLPLFLFIERRAIDPVMNLSYFRDRDILITLACSIGTGIILMAVIFLPQFCENATMMESGSGGYFIIILGLFAGFGAPMSGKFIDQFGVKPVLGAGFVMAMAGSIFLAKVACPHPTLINVIIVLVLIGFGMGFTMGTPLNYMMLQKTDEHEANSALATLSLVRSIGTAIAPAIMVAFIANAGMSMQDNLMEVMPTEVTVSPLPYAQELDEKMADLKADPDMAEMLEGMDIPELSSMSTIEVNMDESDSDLDVEISDEVSEAMQNSDVTTVVDATKMMASDIFGQIKPELAADVTDGIDSGIAKMEEQIPDMDSAIAEMDDGLAEMDEGIEQLQGVVDAMEAAQAAQADAMAAMMGGDMSAMSASGMPAEAMGAMGGGEMPAEAMGASAGDGEDPAAALEELQAGRAELASGRAELADARDSLQETINQLGEVRDAVPGLFDEAEENYLKAIDDNADVIQKTYQDTLNEGFKGMFRLVAICCAIGILILLFYRDTSAAARKRARKDRDASADAAEETAEAAETEAAASAEGVTEGEKAADGEEAADGEKAVDGEEAADGEKAADSEKAADTEVAAEPHHRYEPEAAGAFDVIK